MPTPPRTRDSKSSLQVVLKTHHLVADTIRNDPSISSTAKAALLLDLEKKILDVNAKLSSLSKKVTFDKATQEPSNVSSNQMMSLAEKILQDYREQLQNRPEGVQELTIEEIICQTLKTKISRGKEIQITLEGRTLKVPDMIGDTTIESYIKAIQKIHEDDRTNRAQKKGKGFDDDELYAEAMATSAKEQVKDATKQQSTLPPLFTPHKPATNTLQRTSNQDLSSSDGSSLPKIKK